MSNGIYADPEEEWLAIKEHWRKNPLPVLTVHYRPTCPGYYPDPLRLLRLDRKEAVTDGHKASAAIDKAITN